MHITSMGQGSSAGWDMSAFDEHTDDDATVVSAVVIRRGREGEKKVRRGISVLSFLWSIAKWKLGVRPRPPKVDFEPMPEGFNSATGRGPDRILYSEERRIVRIGDEDYTVPADAGTHVILVDDRGSHRVVSLEAIPRLPKQRRPRYDPSMDKTEITQVLGKFHRAQMAELTAALRANATIASFLDEPATSR